MIDSIKNLFKKKVTPNEFMIYMSQELNSTRKIQEDLSNIFKGVPEDNTQLLLIAFLKERKKIQEIVSIIKELEIMREFTKILEMHIKDNIKEEIIPKMHELRFISEKWAHEEKKMILQYIEKNNEILKDRFNIPPELLT